MRIEHVIYLSSSGCAFWSWLDRQFVESPVKTTMGEDPGTVVEELRRYDPAPIAVLVDMTDEEHIRDVVARLGHRDQRALLERKLARVFPRTPFRAARVQGRNAGNPDENHALLSALTRPEPLRVLLERLADAKLPVAGVFSPSLLTELLLDPQARAARAVLMVLRRSNGRLQHSFFRDGCLAGSRRLRAATTPAMEDPSLMQRQMEESLRYFDPTFAAGPDSPLQVVLSSADFDALKAGEVRSEGWQLRQLEAAELRQRLRLHADVKVGESEQIFIEVLRNHAGRGNFAPRHERRYFQFFRIRSLTRAACVAIAVAALAGTLANGLAILEAGQQAAGSSVTVQQLATLLPGVTAPGSRVDPMKMQQVVTAFDALSSHRADPDYVLAAIGAAVTRRPRIQVDAIEWNSEHAVADAGNGDGETPAAANADSITVTLKGHVTPFGGNYPLAFDELQDFMDALRENPDIRTVTPRVGPLEVSSSSTLAGEVAAGAPPGEAPFTLEIVMGFPGESA